LKALNERLGKTDASISPLVGPSRSHHKDRSKLATSPMPEAVSIPILDPQGQSSSFNVPVPPIVSVNESSSPISPSGS